MQAPRTNEELPHKEYHFSMATTRLSLTILR
jgi:hypothetical protein